MDTSRISFGEMVAAAGGAALFIVMFFPWYGISARGVGLNVNAWESFSFIDILLLIASLLAVGMALARASGNMPGGLPAPPGQIVAGAGALAVILILFRLINLPGDDVSELAGVDLGRKIGIFLGLIAAGGITFGGFTARNERESGQVPSSRRPRPGS